MTNQYIRILKESMCRKKEILEELIRLSERQGSLAREDETDWVLFDECTDQKLERIEELNKLDEGFEMVFAHVQEVLEENKAAYAEDIAFLQKCIRMVTDLSTSLEALEYRNKQSIEQKFAMEKRDAGKKRVTARAATTYYQNTKQLNTIDPQLMDQKK